MAGLVVDLDPSASLDRDNARHHAGSARWALRYLHGARTAERAPVFHRFNTGCLGVSLVFCFTGIGHFLRTEPLAEMLPPWIPAAVALVYITGVVELAATVALVIPRFRRLAGWGLAAMLLLFLPVNVYAAVNRVGMGGHLWGPVYLCIRVPLQLILIWWIRHFAVRRATAPSAS